MTSAYSAMADDSAVFQEVRDVMKSHGTQLVLGWSKIHMAELRQDKYTCYTRV